ncbi:MAG: PadR family transcriptional regulator [Acidimicrobiales bacterium]
MSLRHALLGLLAERPASGYELTKHFELSLANVWSAKHSQIYPELVRMAADGWVEAGEEGARGRRDYRITPAGRAELRRWLTEVEPDRASRNEAMLRIFFLGSLDDHEASAYLRREAEAYRSSSAALDRLDGAIPWDEGTGDRMGRIALEQGRRWSRMMADWADWAAEQIDAGHDATKLTERVGATADRRPKR